MYNNKLQINDANTEVMQICSVHNQSKFNISHIDVGDSEIQPVSVVRNIGAQLDETLRMRSHVNSLCSRAHFYLRNISKIRHLLDRKTTATLVHAYVTSRLDNGNVMRTPSNSAIQDATSPERSCSHGVSDWPTGAHHSSTERTTLAACPSADLLSRYQP